MEKNTLYFKLIIITLALILVANIGVLIRVIQLQTKITSIFPENSITPLTVGEVAPPLNISDLENPDSALNELRKGKYIIVFSSVSCSACRDFWPSLASFRNNYPDIGVIMISKGSDEENKNISKEQGFDFPILPLNEEVANTYHVPGTPFIYFIGEDQKIINLGFGSTLLTQVKQTLAKQTK